MESTKDQEPLLSKKESPGQQNGTHKISTPSPEASPEQIRTYLFHLLTTKRKLPEDYVRPVVANWKLGSGQELRSYSPAMYLRIFGHEDGWIIYREVMLAKLREDAQAKTMLQKNWTCKLLNTEYLTPLVFPANLQQSESSNMKSQIRHPRSAHCRPHIRDHQAHQE